jgi:hypothetical protein
MKLGKHHNTYLQQWLKYIDQCQNRKDLYEFMMDRGIGNFDSKCVFKIADFFEFSGDHNPGMEFKVPIFDYRYANKVYLDGLSNLEKMVRALPKGHPDLKYYKDQHSKVQKAHDNFCLRMNSKIMNDL